MMKDTDTKHKFIEMRAEGLSFDAITKELNVSKTTLIKWSKEMELDIHNFKAMKYQAVLESYNLTKIHRLKALAKMLSRVEQELESRELKDIATDKLIDMQSRLLTKISSELSLEDLSLLERSDSFMPLIESATLSYRID